MRALEREFIALLGEFRHRGVLKHLVLIGSWCLPVYREHFPIPRFPFTTSDIDFSIHRPKDLERGETVSILSSLIRLGYIPRTGILHQAEKYIPSPLSDRNILNIEFLCEPGRNLVEPLRLARSGIVVVPLPFQKILFANSMILAYQEIPVRVPRPETWAVHKIAISQLRAGKDRKLKMIKDLEGAGIVIQSIGEKAVIVEARKFSGKFASLFKKGFGIYVKEIDIRLPG